MSTPSSFLVDYDGAHYGALLNSGADLVIYESGLTLDWPPAPPYLDPVELDILEDAGKTVIGYVNVAVTDAQRSYWQESWVDYADASEKDWGTVTDTAPDWLVNNRGGVDFTAAHAGPDGFVVDFTDAHWQAGVIGYAETIVSAGYDGVFLDDVGAYFQAGWYSGSYDASWAEAMIRFVIDISDAVHAINPDAFVAVNSGINIGFDSFIDLNGTLWQDYLGAVDAVLIENQYVNEGPGGGQDALSDAVARFQDEAILSVEGSTTAIDVGEWLQFCGDNGVLPYLPASEYYTDFTRPPMLGTDGRDVLKLTVAGVAGGLGGVDTIKGSNGGDMIFGHAGADRLLGKAGRDLIEGGGADDMLFGSFGADTLRGGNGRDTLDGGRASDNLTGGRGADRFVFHAGDGNDRIEDFEAGLDTLVIASGAASMDDVTITQRGQGVRLEFDGLTLMLAGLHKGDIHAADFDFA